MDDDERFSIFDGKEQQIDPKRTLRVKTVRKGMLVAPTAQAAKNYDRIFGERSASSAGAQGCPPPLGSNPDGAPLRDDVKAKRHFRDNFERIFGGDR